MSYKLIPLGELGEIVSGSTPDTTNKAYWDGDIPWITPADLTKHEGIHFSGSLRKITEAGYKSCSTRMLPPGSILFSSRAPIGHCAVTAFPLCTNQGFKSIIPNKRLNAVYGFFALKFFTPQIEALGRGATFTEVNKEIFENISIPLPPLPEQRRIAAILAQADRLRYLRRTARHLGDTYLQSVFVEMFGDLAINSMQWDETTLEEIATKVTDGEHVTPERTNSGIKLLSARNIKNGYIDFNAGLDYISRDEYNRIRVRLNPEYGDVLMSCSGTVGRVTTVNITEPFSMVRSVALIKPDRSLIKAKFLEHYLRSNHCQELILRSSNVSSQPNIFQRQIRELPIIVPALDVQEHFVSIVISYERLQTQQREAERQAEHLFQALLHQSFEVSNEH